MTPSSALRPNSRHAGIARFLPHWVPMLFIGGFLVVVGVNATLIYFAQDTFSGLETASPYERGLEYNKTLAAEAAQDRLGWQSQTRISSEAEGMHSLQVRMTDRDGRPLDGLTLVAHLVRPSNEGLDVTVTAQPMGDGRYGVSFVLPAAGQWELRVVAQDDDVAEKLTALGARQVAVPGNLKLVGDPLPFDADVLAELRSAIGGRPMWLLASSHDGEEQLAAFTHRDLTALFPRLLTVIVPRHPQQFTPVAGGDPDYRHVARDVYTYMIKG
ncbi:MAG: hypothetical protein HC869_04045 [Rhodospirillales bacterium]|nr:hypothetical protein [Rhodospirillales bacterium]